MAASNLNMQKASGGILNIQPVDGVTNTSVTIPESGNLVSVDTAVTDNAIARYDGTTGKLQNSGVRVDDRGNVGIGVTPGAWAGCYPIQLGNSGGIYGFNNSNTLEISANSTCNGTNDIYTYSGNAASKYSQSGGNHYWKIAPSGTAGNAITWTNAMSLDVNGNLLLTSGTGVLGYGPGSGGVVAQLTSKSTTITLNKPSGTIVTHNESLAFDSTVYFQFNNSLLRAGDCILINNSDWGAYEIQARVVTNGYAVIYVTNTGATQEKAIPIQYQIIKGSNL